MILLCKRSKELQKTPQNQALVASSPPRHQSVLGGFISENNSSTVDCATWRTRSVLSIPAMLTPFTTALISSRKSVRKRKGSDESLATRAISPVIRIWHAIMRPFSSSILHPRLPVVRRARYGRHRSGIQPCAEDTSGIASHLK